MKRTITSLMVMVCAILVTSFVLPADQKNYKLQNKKKLDDVYIVIENDATGIADFTVYFKSLTTGEVYTFNLINGDDGTGGLPIDTYTIWISANTSDNYRLQACSDYAYSNYGGKAVNSMNVGPDGVGCNQFYVYYYPNP